MAQYKVPQDVEADDKLLGPFTFRQFVYLMITGAFIGVGFALFQIFPLLALLAAPFVVFFGALALPIKRDQPMETYLAAIVSFRLKPNKRFWDPGQRESTIEIIAPKIVEEPRMRDISEEEASNRLSFLANVIDTEGYAVRGDINSAPLRNNLIAEENNVPDILDVQSSPVINQMLAEQQNQQHQALLNQMRTAIQNSEYANNENYDVYSNTNIINPINNTSFNQTTYPGSQLGTVQQSQYLGSQEHFRDLAHNNDFSIATISQQANRTEQPINNGNSSSY